MSVRQKLVIFIAVLLVLDQAVKIWIKTHMMLGEEFSVFGDWFKILFIENNGMAFGMELGDGRTGKTILSLFRIVAVGAIGWYILKLFREKAPTGVLFSFALIFFGAIGKIFYSRWRLLFFFTREGGRHALFSVVGRCIAFVDSVLGRPRLCLFPTGF